MYIKVILSVLLIGIISCTNSKENKLDKNLVIVISEHLEIKANKITSKNTFKSLGADDLDLVEIIIKIEEVKNIKIKDDKLFEIAKIDQTQDLVANLSIGKLSDYIQSLQ